MKVLGVIPARYHSTRFEGKPLVLIKGKTMIQRVYEQAVGAVSLKDVVVATDNENILMHVLSFGGKAVMTSDAHPSGTDRCLEVVNLLSAQNKNYDVIVNIQGDEPFIDPHEIDKTAACFSDTNIQIATLAKQIYDISDLQNPNVVKLIKDINQKAIYFSRFPVPYFKSGLDKDTLNKHSFFKHIGLYAYRTEVLKKICQLPPSSLEKAESLEQLRWLENAYQIHVLLSDYDSVSVDTPEDLRKIEAGSHK